MRLSGQFRASLIFFFAKRLRAYKNANQPKPTNKNKKKRTKNNKENGFSAHKNFQEGRNHLFFGFGAFCTLKTFRKNK